MANQSEHSDDGSVIMFVEPKNREDLFKQTKKRLRHEYGEDYVKNMTKREISSHFRPIFGKRKR